MERITSYRKLKVWNKAVELVEECYRLTKKFPKYEMYGLSSQIQRAAVSIPSNIAEGRQRIYRKEFIKHLSIAHGSLAELETQIEIANRLNYIEDTEREHFFESTTEIGKMLTGLKRALKEKS